MAHVVARLPEPERVLILSKIRPIEWACLATLVGLVLVLFLPVVFMDEGFYFRDLTFNHLGRKHVATELLTGAVADLTTHLSTALKRAGPWPEPPGLALSGGLLGDGGPLRAALVTAAADYPVRFVSGALDPSMGAAKMALAALREAQHDA